MANNKEKTNTNHSTNNIHNHNHNTTPTNRILNPNHNNIHSNQISNNKKNNQRNHHSNNNNHNNTRNILCDIIFYRTIIHNNSSTRFRSPFNHMVQKKIHQNSIQRNDNILLLLRKKEQEV